VLNVTNLSLSCKKISIVDGFRHLITRTVPGTFTKIQFQISSKLASKTAKTLILKFVDFALKFACFARNQKVTVAVKRSGYLSEAKGKDRKGTTSQFYCV